MVNVWKMSTVALAVALGVSIGGGVIRTASAEPQPKMEDGLAKLQDAKGWLDRAADDKGGHRAKAIGFAQQAIDETKAGIKFANEHH
jgi:hypothetical protein